MNEDHTNELSVAQIEEHSFGRLAAAQNALRIIHCLARNAETFDTIDEIAWLASVALNGGGIEEAAV